MNWEVVFNSLAPYATQGFGTAALVIVALIRGQFTGIRAEQRKQGALLMRLVRLHCAKYPKDALGLLEGKSEEE